MKINIDQLSNITDDQFIAIQSDSELSHDANWGSFKYYVTQCRVGVGM